jgi:hypothetical protein
VKLFGLYRQAWITLPAELAGSDEVIDNFIENNSSKIIVGNEHVYDIAAVSINGGRSFIPSDTAYLSIKCKEFIKAADPFLLELIKDESENYSEADIIRRYLQITYDDLIIGGNHGH